MDKPKTQRKETAIGVAMILGDNFTKESFIEEFREVERRENPAGVSFPLGVVKDDVEYLLSFLLGVGIIQEDDAGLYSCMIEL